MRASAQENSDQKAPYGYRFLIQLADAATIQDAHREILAMYGANCLQAAVFRKGTTIGYCPESYPVVLSRVETGYTVFIPKDFRHEA